MLLTMSSPISRCIAVTRSMSGECSGVYTAACTGSLYMFHFFNGMPSMANVKTAGTILARSSTKSMRPLSIFSSRQARVTSSMNGSQRLIAAGDRYGLSTVR